MVASTVQLGAAPLGAAENGTITSIARSATDPLLHILMGTLVANVSSDNPDLTARQLAVFLKIYLESGIEHTVRGLAADLNESKPAVTRAPDRLEALDFTKREKDRLDRRSVIARRTPTGSAHLRTLGGYMVQASKQATPPKATGRPSPSETGAGLFLPGMRSAASLARSVGARGAR